jgi:hypothetical protein
LSVRADSPGFNECFDYCPALLLTISTTPLLLVFKVHRVFCPLISRNADVKYRSITVFLAHLSSKVSEAYGPKPHQGATSLPHSSAYSLLYKRLIRLWLSILWTRWHLRFPSQSNSRLVVAPTHWLALLITPPDRECLLMLPSVNTLLISLSDMLAKMVANMSANTSSSSKPELGRTVGAETRLFRCSCSARQAQASPRELHFSSVRRLHYPTPDRKSATLRLFSRFPCVAVGIYKAIGLWGKFPDVFFGFIWWQR